MKSTNGTCGARSEHASRTSATAGELGQASWQRGSDALECSSRPVLIAWQNAL